MSLPLCSTLINCYHTVNYKHCHKKKRSDRYLVQRYMFAQENDLFEFDFILSFFHSVATNVFITSCFGSHWYWRQICAQIWLVDTISTVLLGKQCVCVCVCVCVGVSEWERQEERKWFFFILLGYFVFVSENEGKKETGQWDRKERGKWENRLQLSIREVIGQRRLHYLLFRRAHSLYSQEATV